MEENTTKNGLTIKFCFEHCKAQSFTLKIRTFSFCAKEQLKMSLSDRMSSIVREEIVSTSLTKLKKFENNAKMFSKSLLVTIKMLIPEVDSSAVNLQPAVKPSLYV